MISRVEGTRQSDRVSLRLHVNASWFASDGTAVKQAAETLLVSRNGGVLRLTEKLFAGQEITLHRELEGDQSKSARARIVAEIDREGDGFITRSRFSSRAWISGISSSLRYISPRKPWRGC